MGRKRTKNHHLPPGIEQHGRKFRARIKGKKVPVADSVAEAWTWHQENCEQREIRTIADLCDRYMAEILPDKSASWQRDVRSMMPLIKRKFGHGRPRDVRPRHVYQFRNELRDTPAAANNHVALLGSLFTLAIELGLVDENPCRHVKKFPRARSEVYVTDEERDTAKKYAPPMYALLIDFAEVSGRRRGEILAITRDDLTDEGIVIQASKGGPLLLLEWSDELDYIVQSALALGPPVRRYVFCNRNGHKITPTGFDSAWRRLREKMRKAGHDLFAFRDLRAKSASDDDLEAAQKRLGHTRPEITQRVYRRKPDKVKPLR